MVRIRRYLGGRQVQAAQDEASNVITAREAAGAELGKMNAVNQALGSMQRATARYSEQVQRQQAEDAQLRLTSAQAKLSQAYTAIATDPNARAAYAADPTNYFQKALSETVTGVEADIDSIENPQIRAVAQQRLGLMVDNIGSRFGELQNKFANDEYVGRNMETFSVAESAEDWQSMEATRVGLEGRITPVQNAAMVKRIDQTRLQAQGKALATDTIEAYRTGGVAEGDAALAEMDEQMQADGVDERTRAQAMTYAKAARADAEAAGRAQVRADRAQYEVAVNDDRRLLDTGVYDYDDVYYRAYTLEAYGDPEEPWAQANIKEILNAARTQQTVNTNTALMDQFMGAGRSLRGLPETIEGLTVKDIGQYLTEYTTGMTEEERITTLQRAGYLSSDLVYAVESGIAQGGVHPAQDQLLLRVITSPGFDVSTKQLSPDGEAYVDALRFSADLVTGGDPTALDETSMLQASEMAREAVFPEDPNRTGRMQELVSRGTRDPNSDYYELREDSWNEYEEAFNEANNMRWNELPQADQMQIMARWREAYDYAFTRYGGNAGLAARAAMNTAKVNSHVSSVGSGKGDLRYNRLAPSLRGFMPEFDQEVRNRTAKAMLEGRAFIADEDGDFVSELEGMNDMDYDIIELNSADFGATEAIFAPMFNGDFVYTDVERTFIDAEGNKKTVTVPEKLVLTLPRSELERITQDGYSQQLESARTEMERTREVAEEAQRRYDPAQFEETVERLTRQANEGDPVLRQRAPELEAEGRREATARLRRYTRERDPERARAIAAEARQVYETIAPRFE